MDFFKVDYTTLAEQDIIDTVDYLEQNVSPAVATRFLRAIEEAEQSLASFWSHEVKYDDVRTWSVGKFPYLMHYSVDKETKTVLVETVLHMKRDSKLRK